MASIPLKILAFCYAGHGRKAIDRFVDRDLTYGLVAAMNSSQGSLGVPDKLLHCLW